MQAASLCWTKRCDFNLDYLHTRWQSLCSWSNLGLLEPASGFPCQRACPGFLGGSGGNVAGHTNGPLCRWQADRCFIREDAGQRSHPVSRCRDGAGSVSGQDTLLQMADWMLTLPWVGRHLASAFVNSASSGASELVVPSFRGGHHFSVGLDTCAGSSKIIAGSIL